MGIDIPKAYRSNDARWWQTLSDTQMVIIVAFVVGGVWTRRPFLMIGAAALVLAVRRRKIVGWLCAVAAIGGCVLGTNSWSAAQPRRLGPYSGVARIMTDPTPRSGAMQVVFEIDGQRYETWARGSPKRRLTHLLAGDYVWVSGELVALSGSQQHRAAIKHVVGKFDAEAIGDVFPGSPFDQASNRVRRLLAKGAESLRTPEDALFAGLVIGDDRYEPPAMIQQFRASGMSHLTAVSGQNVAFVLAAAAPLLRRLRASWRWLATLGLIMWFIALTRFEPSVLRAGCMAAISATGYLLGRERPPARVLPLAVGGLVILDPMLVWSVGFWLSIGATAGVSVIGPRVAKLIPGPAWLSAPLSVTIGAQIGVAPVSLMVFGSLPIVSVPANLLAVPVAGFVMLYGLPAGILAGMLPPWAAAIVQFPSAIGTRWVAIVANLASRIEPAAPWPAIGWLTVASVLAFIRLRRWLQPQPTASKASDSLGTPSTASRQ